MARHCHHLRPSSRPREPATTPSARGLIASSTHQNRRSPRNPDWDLSGQTTGTSVSERSAAYLLVSAPCGTSCADACRTSGRTRMERRHTPLRSIALRLSVPRRRRWYLVLPPVVSRRVARRPRPKEPVGVGPGATPRFAVLRSARLCPLRPLLVPRSGGGRSRQN